MGPQQAIILFAHGSRDPHWRAPLDALAAQAQTLAPQALVCCAFLEHSAPSLEQAAAHCLAQGATQLHIWPMLLGLGRHTRADLPRLLQALRAQHPQAHISLHPAIAEDPGVQHAMAQALAASALSNTPLPFPQP